MTDRLDAALAELAAAIRAELRERPTAPAAPRLLSVVEAADALGLSRASAYKLITSGALRSRRIGRRRLIPESALREYVEAQPGAEW